MTFLRFNEPEDVVAMGTDFPVEVRRSNLGLVARTTLSQEVDVEPGRYHVSARLPSGSELFGTVEAFGDVAAVDLELDPGDVPAPLADTFLFAPELETLGPGDPGDLTIRFLCGNALSGELEEVHAEEVGSFIASAAPVAGHDRPLLAQLAGPDASPSNAAVPLAGEQEADLELVLRDDGSWALVPHLAHPQADLLCRYRGQGRLHDAATAAASPVLDAEALLYRKVQDPIAAATGAYALLRFAALDRLHDWTENLYQWFPWLPDGAAIRGEHLARNGEHAAALECFCAVGDRGLPAFSDGVAITANRLRLYLDVGSASFGEDALARARRTLQRLAPFAGVIDFGEPIVRFTGDPAELRATGRPGRHLE